MLNRHSSGFEQILDKMLGKSLEELPLHWVLVRGLYHATQMTLEFIIEHQCFITMRELGSCITICCVLCGDFMYKSFIHITNEVLEVPFPGLLIASLNFIYISCCSETSKGSSIPSCSPYGLQLHYKLRTNRVIHSSRYQTPWYYPCQSISLVKIPWYL